MYADESVAADDAFIAEAVQFLHEAIVEEEEPVIENAQEEEEEVYAEDANEEEVYDFDGDYAYDFDEPVEAENIEDEFVVTDPIA